ncbi:MAG: hypothetical protein E3J90_04330 [Promethearchaeota archaeon]|nr:MAG: hypothetical protein E3J90_04330 [Candidatus Lokiarchaeota archaeon]
MSNFMTEEELVESYYYRVMLSKSRLWDLLNPTSKFYIKTMHTGMKIKDKKRILLRLVKVFEGRIANYNNKKEKK